MKNEMSKSKTIWFVVALCLTSIVLVADTAIVPVAGSLYSNYGESVNLVNFIVSGPALLYVLSSLLCAKFMQFFSKKTLLIAAYILFAIGGIFGIAREDPYFIASMRILVGTAMGLVNVSAIALIPEIFSDEKRRSSVVGIFNSATAVNGAILGLAAGFVATISWQAVFTLYWITIPILIMIIVFVPKTPAESKHMDDEGVAVKKEPMPTSVIALAFGMLALNLIYMIIYYQIALYVLENTLGDESIAGVLSAVGTVGSAIASSLLGVTYPRMRRATIIPSYVLILVGYLILYINPSVPMAIVACALMGAGYGNGLSYYNMRSSVIAPPSQVSNSMSLVVAASGLGMFLSTYFATLLRSVVEAQSVTEIMPLMMALSAIGIVLSVILTARNRTHPSEYMPQVGREDV